MWPKLWWRKWGWRMRKEISHAELSRPCVLVSHCSCDKLLQICGRKQYKCIMLQFYRSEVWRESPWTKIKVPAGLHSFPEALGGNPFSRFFQLLEDTYIPWLMVSFLLHSQQEPVESLFMLRVSLTPSSVFTSPWSALPLLGTHLFRMSSPRTYRIIFS